MKAAAECCCCCWWLLINAVAFDCYDVIDDVMVLEVSDSYRPARFTAAICRLYARAGQFAVWIQYNRIAVESITFDSFSSFAVRLICQD